MLGYAKNGIMRPDKITRDLIAPARISVSYISTYIQETIPKIEISLKIESLCILFGFRDIIFFQDIATPWIKLQFNSQTNQSHKASYSNKKSTINTFSLDCDSLQLTLFEDTIKDLYSLLHMQFSNTIGFGEMSSLTKYEFSTLIFIDYFNPKIFAWEPLIEDWKFSLLIKQENKRSPLQLAFISDKFLNINFTFTMAENLSLILKRFSQTTKDWDNEIYYDQEAEIIGKNKKKYQIKNELGKEIEVWIDLPNVEHWKIQDRESVSINQDQIDHLFSQKQVQSKTTSILQSAQTPTALAITFQGYFSVHGIMIENSGIQVLDFSDGNKEIPVLINIQEHQNKRVIFVQSGIVIINNTSLDLAFINNHEELAVEATKAIPIPYNWIESVSNISIKTHIGDILINQGSDRKSVV